MTVRIYLVVLAGLLFASAARAEDCSEESPPDTASRRSQAKQWFSRGEAATAAGDQIAALKAYQCSLKLVPHGFTAFNLAQIAEQVGDLELAISGYNQYLLLAPDAADSQEVKDRVAFLKERLTKLREEDLGAVTAAAIGEFKPPEGLPLPTQPAPTVEKPPQPLPAPTQASEPATEVSVPRQGRHGYRTAAWISFGSAFVLVAGGVISNLVARSEMDTCRTDYNRGDRAAAESACSSAKPYAYLSYAAFGLGAAAAVLGTIFVLQPTEASEVAMGVLPEGGLSLRWAGRF